MTEATDRPRWRVLYSNDTTNMLTCHWVASPGIFDNKHTDKPFDERIIAATVDETSGTGIDVHMIQPGLGWVPLWQSKFYSLANHRDFIRTRYGAEPSDYGLAKFVMEGGDVVKSFVDRCREKNLAPFVSLRLNDSHGREYAEGATEKAPGWSWILLSEMVISHPEWSIAQDWSDWDRRVLNWAIPEVPEVRLKYVSELCENYDLDGFELDFMRHCSFFDREKTPLEERRRIMTQFVGNVRGILDRTSAGGSRRSLCVRVPAHVACLDYLGIDIDAFAKAGVDMFNLSYHYFTGQDGDLAAIRQMAPGAAMYVEMCHTTFVGKNFDAGPGYDCFPFRRTTPNQFYTTAHLAYSRGFDGVSAFNFAYYREHGAGPRGPFCEPPFEVFNGLANRDWLAKQPQHYFLAARWVYAGRVSVLGDPYSPTSIEPGKTTRLTLDMAPPVGGWREGGRLRIQSPVPLGDTKWNAVFEGVELAETDDRSEPYGTPYPNEIGAYEQHRAWSLPAVVLRDGINSVDITLLAPGARQQIVFVDVMVR